MEVQQMLKFVGKFNCYIPQKIPRKNVKILVMAKEDFSVFAMDDRTVICCESNI